MNVNKDHANSIKSSILYYLLVNNISWMRPSCSRLPLQPTSLPVALSSSVLLHAASLAFSDMFTIHFSITTEDFAEVSEDDEVRRSRTGVLLRNVSWHSWFRHVFPASLGEHTVDTCVSWVHITVRGHLNGEKVGFIVIMPPNIK